MPVSMSSTRSLFALGGSDGNLAHAASVRSNRLVTAVVSTRSLAFRFSLVTEPSTGDLATYDRRHADDIIRQRLDTENTVGLPQGL